MKSVGSEPARRRFLRALAAGAAALVGGGATLPVLADTETLNQRKRSRYRETDHVKAYYRVNRY